LTVWVTFSGIALDKLDAKLGYLPKIDRNLPRDMILAIWTPEKLEEHEDWREIARQLYDEEE
jgi:hypothetical protein